MLSQYKKFIRTIMPESLRIFIYRLIPNICKVNTYLLKRYKSFNDLPVIDKKYVIREINRDDLEAIKKYYTYRGEKAFQKTAKPRLNSPEWVGLAVFDSTNGEIAYIAWIIAKSICYIEEFGIKLKTNQFLLKDGYCVPHYRHQGLHSRMEQERINYCIRNGANEIFIQIHAENKGGVKSVLENGYKLYKQNYVIHLPLFHVFREYGSFAKNPFKKVIT